MEQLFLLIPPGIILGCMIIGQCGNLFWWCDLFSHWKIQYGFALCVVGLSYIIIPGQHGLIDALGALSILAGVAMLHPVIFSRTSKNIQHPDIYFLNALYTNQDIRPHLDEIRMSKPLLIGIVELPPSLRAGIISLGYREIVSLDNKYDSQGWFALTDVVSEISDVWMQDGFPYPISHICWRGKHILLVHPFPAILSGLAQNQHTAFKEIQICILSLRGSGPVIVIGDLNSSIFSAVFHKYFGTYFTPLLYTWCRGTIWALPIDHVISTVRCDVQVNPRKTSDHSSLMIKIP